MQPQSVGLFRGELKHEVFRKTAPIAAHRQVQILGQNLIESGEIGIEQDFLAANKIDAALDRRDGGEAVCHRLYKEAFAPDGGKRPQEEYKGCWMRRQDKSSLRISILIGYFSPAKTRIGNDRCTTPPFSLP